MPSHSAPWEIYEEALAPLKYGHALWEPSPIYSYRRVRLGDVGYIREGRFHLLFSAGIPLGARRKGIEVPLTFEELEIDPVIYAVRPEGHLHPETSREIGADVGASVSIAYVVEPGAEVAFELIRKQGAALITKHPTRGEFAERSERFVEYVEQHYDSWVEFVRKGGFPKDAKPILVTGVDLTREFAMIAYSDNQTRVKCKFSAALPGLASTSTSLWGSWHTTGLVWEKCGPHPMLENLVSAESSALGPEVQDGYTQCIFIKYCTFRKRDAILKRLGIPIVLKAGAGPHQLPKRDEGDNSGEEGLRTLSPEDSAEPDPPETGSSRDEVIHNVPTDDCDSFDVVAEFIFRRSDAKSVFLHHDDIEDFLQGDKEDLARLLAESGAAERIEINKNGVGQLRSPPAAGSPKLISLDSKTSEDTNRQISPVGATPVVYVTRQNISAEASKTQRPNRREDFRRTHAQAEKQRRIEEAKANQIPISGIEFGWDCGNDVFSCEWEKLLDPLGSLDYDEDRREFRINFGSKSIVLRSAQINWASCGMDGPLPAIYFNLGSHPVFEEAITVPHSDPNIPLFGIPQRSTFTRTRISSLDPDHERVVAYTSLAVRFVCDSPRSLEMFHTLCRISPLGDALHSTYHKEYRQLFSKEIMVQFDSWLALLDFEVAFQVEKIVRDAGVDFREILALRREIGDLVRSKGVQHTVSALRSFHCALEKYERGGYLSHIPALFRTIQQYAPKPKSLAEMAFDDTFSCYHVSVTPTAMKLSGPFQERSNRVFRRYSDHHSCFIRVTFEEETRLQLRFDRDVDGATFVKKRYGTIIRETGLEIAGRWHFFLAYSQSALKEHSVWFMRPFRNEDGDLVDPAFIIDSLGDFGNSPDSMLFYCPGRYGARISQAFTSTDSGVSIRPEEIREVPDIEVPKDPDNPSAGKYNFTDGVGTISPELMKEIWDTIRARRRSARRVTFYPKCYQIRFQGCKGMVSVNYRQTGRELVLRPSMIKFQAPEWSEIEIVRAFDRPSPFYLNRPLITVLEALGVAYETFKEYLDGAVMEVKNARWDLEQAGRLLESFGLGASFRLSSIMYHLHKLGVPMQNKDPFYKNLMDFAIDHVLRELKHHARIPIPGHTLVGVADVHGWLQPTEVFACYVNQQTKQLEYLEGDMVITRSPVIHPGDVQIVTAIGKPPPGSPFEKEPLPNAVVFSIKGDRPIPSKAGGGDLDGDLYNIASLRDLPIQRTYQAATYTDAPKKILDRKCTMDDVADFVADYINSDVLGLVATNWLIIADQSDESVFDKDCMTLAQLHSDAIAYPKSSTPVPLAKIPRPKSKTKPDWSQSENANDSKSADYYESQRAIGRLFREIKLPDIDIARRVNRAQRKKMHEEDDDHSVTQLGRTSLWDGDEVDVAVRGCVTDFINADVDPDYRTRALSLFGRYTVELKTICASYTIPYRRSAMLTEEEVAVGTIVARTSQPRHRHGMISKLGDQTNLRVEGVRNELVSEEDGFETKLAKAWALWRVTQEKRKFLGARTLGLIALGVIFDAMTEFEEEAKGYD